VLAWLGSLGWLVQREYFPKAGTAAQSFAATLPPSATFYAMWSRDRQIGIASATADTVEDGIRIVARQDLDLPLGEGPRRAIFSSNGHYSEDLRLLSFSSRLSGETGGYLLEGTVEGDSLLLLSFTASTDSEPERHQLTLPGPILLPEAVPLSMARQGPLEVGREADVAVFDPVRLTLYRQHLTVAAESILVVPDSAEVDPVSGLWVPAHLDTLNAWRLDTWDRGIPVHLWVDQGGYVIASRSPLGVRVERSAFEIVRGNYRGRGRAAVATDAMAPRGTPLPQNALDPSPTTNSAVRLAGADTAGPDWQRLGLDGAGQTRRGDTVLVHPVDATVPEVSADETQWMGLAAPMLALADPRVEARARQIARRTKDPSTTAAALVSWVSRNLSLAPDGVPQSAGLTLDRRRGSTSDIVLAFVALARASGLSARPVAGFLQSGRDFHYHAWAEVYLDRWLPVDPVYGQVPVDGRHVRIVVDGLSRPLELVPLVARIRPEPAAGGDDS
jgi:transglutaminase-like putative cysteine protease